MTILKIGMLEIPTRAALDLEQTYEFIGGETTLRTVSGAGIKQQTWKKTRTTISGGGWLPPGIAALDTAAILAVACIVPRAIGADASRQATLPAARRSDAGHTPWAVAILPGDGIVATSLSFAGHVGTAGLVAGAIGYLIHYYPLLSCLVNRPAESGSRADASYRWEIVAEEV